MEWYYANSNNPMGPLSDQEFQSLVAVGTITLSTLVWHQGMHNWQPYSHLSSQGLNPGEEPTTAEKPLTAACFRCGLAHPEAEMDRFGDYRVCEKCKQLLLQDLKEGAGAIGTLPYAGFWIRFAAKLVDGLILMVISLIFSFGAGLITTSYADPYNTIYFKIFLYLVQVFIGATYTTWFLGTFGATPGKMAFSLRVVIPDGGDISYLRAFGRHIAEWLSWILLGAGYLMVAFDAEKRALHDRICKTRVIRRR